MAISQTLTILAILKKYIEYWKLHIIKDYVQKNQENFLKKEGFLRSIPNISQPENQRLW